MTVSTIALANIAAQAEAARKAHAAAVDALKARTEFTPDYIAEQIQELRNKLTDNVYGLTEQYRAERERLSTADRIADNRPAADQMLDDTRRAAAWDRARELIEHGTPWRQLANDAAADGDTATLAALADRVPHYLIAGLPAGTEGRRTRAAAIRTDVQQSLDPLLAESGTGVYQQGAQIRQQIAAATETAAAALDAVNTTAQGRFDPMAAAVRTQLAAQAAAKV